MAQKNKGQFEKEYKRLLKIIDKCGKKGICLEDVIVALIENILYQNNPKNGYDPSAHHHLAILLIKLLILNYPEEVTNPSPGNMDCSSLINPLVKLSGYPVALREEEQSARFWLEIFRPMSFQQFYLQRYQHDSSFFANHLRRQRAIFSLSEPLSKLFQEKSGISVADFSQCSLRCAQLLDQRSFMTADDLASLPNSTVFLSLLSRTIRPLKSFLRDEDNQVKKSLQSYCASTNLRPLWADFRVVQFWEESPLKRYPLLKIGNRHYCYSPSLLKSALNNFAYTFLKAEKVSMLKEEEYLSGALEQYVNGMLKAHFSGRFLWLDGTDKEEAKTAFRVGSNQITDFLVAADNDVLLIEVKAQDPRKRLNKLILDSSRYGLADIIEAAKQGLSTAKWIIDAAPQEVRGVTIPIPTRFFLVVLTYGEFYLPNGRVLSQTGAAADIPYTDYLPQESVFCMALDQFERFLETVKGENINPCDILRFASEQVAAGDDRIEFEHYVSGYTKTLRVTLPETSYSALDQIKVHRGSPYLASR